MIEELEPYESYQATELPWARRLPAHWNTKRGKAVLAQSMLPTSDDQEIVTCFRDGQVTLRRNRRTSGFMVALYEQGYQGVRKGQLVVHAMDAFAGAIGLSDSDGKCTPEYVVCNARGPSVHLPYVAQALRVAARDGFILASCPSVRERAPRFRWANLGDFLVPLPPPDEQAAIVRFLDHANRRIDQFIRAKKKLIALLNEQKQGIIHRMVTRGLDPNVKLKDSGVPWLGEVPAHWDSPLNQRIFKEEIRSHHGRPETQLSLSQRDGLVAKSDLRERSLQTSSFDNWKLVLPGDLVLNRFKAHLGVFFAAKLRGIVSFHYGVFAPRVALCSEYFELLFHTVAYRAIYAGRSNGMTVGLQNLSNQNFYCVRAVAPPEQEQRDIVEACRRRTIGLDQSVEMARREVALLHEYRSRLIADVVTGQLDVRAAAASLPDIEPEAVPSASSAEDETDIDDNEAA